VAPRGPLSGGLDSTVVLATALEQGTCPRAHRRVRAAAPPEVEAARAVARHYGVEHRVVRVDLSAFGGPRSPTSPGPCHRPAGRGHPSGGIPSTYVPARNAVLISVALAWAEALGSEAVLIGANCVDYSGYPDCRPEFIEAMREVARLGTRRGAEGSPHRRGRAHPAPREGGHRAPSAELGVPFELTWSCYRGTPRACGRCDSCQLRLQGFAEAASWTPCHTRRARRVQTGRTVGRDGTRGWGLMEVCEMFVSLQGEGADIGLPTVFIRLARCNLECTWCDTKYSWEPGQERSVEDLVEEASSYGVPRVAVTGGEPMMQSERSPSSARRSRRATSGSSWRRTAPSTSTASTAGPARA